MKADARSSSVAPHPVTQLLIATASQAAVLTAVLYYLGWVRTRATFAYFNIDTSTLGFSAADYVLRSVNAAMRPLIVVVLLVLIGASLHSRLRQSPRSDRKAKLVAQAAALAGLTMSIGGFALVSLPLGASSTLGPPMLCAGFAALTYWVAQTARHARLVQLFTLGLLVVLSFLWSSSSYASYVGEQTAREWAANLNRLPRLVVLADKDLSLNGPGVTVRNISTPDGAYRFRYEGLRLLVRSGERIFAVPSDWRPDNGVIVVLSDKGDAGSMRIELHPPTK